MPPLLLPKNQDPYIPVASRTRSKNPQISALIQIAPQPINLAGEGVQKICQQLINETAEEDRWILVIKKPKRKPSWQKQLARHQLKNYQATGDPIFEPIGDDDCIIEWEDSVYLDPQSQQQPYDPATYL